MTALKAPDNPWSTVPGPRNNPLNIPATGRNGFVTQLASRTRLDVITTRSGFAEETNPPVQLLNRKPGAGTTVSKYDRPTSRLCPFMAPITLPPGLTTSVNGL